MAIKKTIAYPYIPEDGVIEYVPSGNPFLKEAREYARLHALDKNMPNASVLVKDGKIIGRGANGNTYHETQVCERVRLGIPTGQGYELCEGCHPRNHSEPKATKNAQEQGNNTHGADIYLWGHWWCCESCWNTIRQAGINKVFLLEGSEQLFNKDNPNNIIGKQFA